MSEEMLSDAQLKELQHSPWYTGVRDAEMLIREALSSRAMIVELRAVLREIVKCKKRHLFGVPLDLVDVIERAEKLLEGK